MALLIRRIKSRGMHSRNSSNVSLCSYCSTLEGASNEVVTKLKRFACKKGYSRVTSSLIEATPPSPETFATNRCETKASHDNPEEATTKYKSFEGHPGGPMLAPSTAKFLPDDSDNECYALDGTALTLSETELRDSSLPHLSHFDNECN